MRKRVFMMAAVLLGSSVTAAPAKDIVNLSRGFRSSPTTVSGATAVDIPARAERAARFDTVTFGYYTIKSDGRAYAVIDEEWNFDRGAADPLEGWTSVDRTENDQAYWRHMTQAQWSLEGGPPPWPAMSGSGMVLCGATEGHADTLGWEGGVGYGNNWCQRLTSPTLTYDGTGDVGLSLNYFSEAELDYDYVRLFVETAAGRVMINAPGFTGEIGIDALGVITLADYLKTITNSDFGGGVGPQEFRLVIEFASDNGFSDEDLASPEADSFYGGAGIDDIQFDGTNLTPPVTIFYGFETDLQGWAASKCPGIGSFLGIGNLASYSWVDPCACSLRGNLLEIHDETLHHPDGQHEILYSPIVDRENDIPGGDYLSYNRILAEWDFYHDLPVVNGVFCRARWSYYPYENPQVPGLIQWSPPVGINTEYFVELNPGCDFWRSIGTDWGIPAGVTQVRFLYEIFASCDAFGVDPCSGVTNFSPLLDNISIRAVRYVAAPIALFEPGTRFQDGFGQAPGGTLSTTDPGNADIVYDLRHGSTQPTRLGDSLMVTGPGVITVGSRWEAKLWLRLKRRGPGQEAPGNPGLATYNQWKNTVTTHRGDFYSGANPSFAWGYMDSVEAPTAKKNQFCSQFRELTPNNGQQPEPCFCWGGGTEQGEGNEILPDGVFTPGTKIEYFITTNYKLTPTVYYFYPDTAGGVYQEFEILPSFREVAGVDKFPRVLYVDAENRDGQLYIENALNTVLNGAAVGDPIPDPTTWDRYDYLDAYSSWKGPLHRTIGGNSGATIPQLLGYRLILVSTGTQNAGSLEPRDWQGFQQWLDTALCLGNANLQGFIADGASIAETLDRDFSPLLNETLGATYGCATYSDLGCPSGESSAQNDQNDCVRLEPAAGSPFGAGIPSDLFGNWCPTMTDFNVVQTAGSGVGNKLFEKVEGGHQTSFAQVINDRSGAGGPNYRSVVQSCSYSAMITRDENHPGLGECFYPTDAASDAARLAAVTPELENAIQWTLNLSDPATELGLGVNPCLLTELPEVAGGTPLVTCLHQNRPNPFNPRTAVRFSLAADGPAKLLIFDVAGRQVRALIDQSLKAGTHEVVWDGTDDTGQPVTSGVYWSQLQAGDITTNKKMVVLK